MVLSLYEANRTATRGFLPVSTPAVWRVKGHLQWHRKEQKDAEEVHSPTMRLIVTLADTVATEPRSYHPATGSNTGQTAEGDCLGKAGQDAPGQGAGVGGAQSIGAGDGAGGLVASGGGRR